MKKDKPNTYAKIEKTVRQFRRYMEVNIYSNPEKMKEMAGDYNEMISASEELKSELSDHKDDLSKVDELEAKLSIIKHVDEMKIIVNKIEKSLNMKAFW
jgi:DNA repair exonuclease SbcCD ATPase subunit